MIDTIKLFTQEYDIAKNNQFQKQTIADYSTGELKYEKVFCNLDSGARFTIKPDNRLYIETSLPKLLWKTSLKEIQESDFELCLDTLQAQFNKAGIITDSGAINDMAVSRIDYCRNLEVNHSIVDYLAILKNCYCSKRDKTSWKTETVTFFNNSQELCIYNKILEVKSDKKQMPFAGVSLDTPENKLRIESRLKQAKVIKNVLHKRTFAECFSQKTATGKLVSDFDAIVQNVGQQIELNLGEMNNLLYEYRQQGRDALGEIEKKFGRDAIINMFQHDLALIKKWLENHYQRRQVYYYLKNYKKHIAENRTPEQRNLLQEIRLKLAA